MQADYSKVFRAYDIRGVVGKELDSSMVAAIARAFGDHLRPAEPGRFVIGHDDRWSSAAFAEAASVGLRRSGHRVTHMGQASTPMVYWYGAEGGFDGSIAVSASHLAPEYNGLKLCARDAVPLSGDHGLPEIARRLRAADGAGAGEPPGKPPSESVHHVAPLAEYVAHLRRHLRPARPVRIAVDAGNGMGGLATEPLLATADTVELWRLNFHPDPKFPVRPANPLLDGACDQLAEVVKRNRLDFGLAFDGDADRAVVVDERGALVPPDALGGLIALHLLAPGATILHDLRVSRAIPEEITGRGGKVVRSRVGHAFIKRAMRDCGAVFAMELSGHYYYADLHYTDNGLRTLIELVNIVAAAAPAQPLSQLAAPFMRYPTSGEINLPVADVKALLARLEQRFADGKVDHLDGLSVDYPDWWLNVRPSQTEPLVRINLGATTAGRLAEKRRLVLDAVDEERGATAPATGGRAR